MLDTPLMKRLGVTPAKLIAIVVLAVVLICVVAWQWPTGGAAPAHTTNAVAGGARASAALAAKANKQSVEADHLNDPRANSAPWPELTLQDAVQNNPFLLPASFRPTPNSAGGDPANPQDAYSQQILQELSQAESAIVLMAEGEHVARIGAKRIRPGDKIGPYRVSKIDATGVWLVDESQIPK